MCPFALLPFSGKVLNSLFREGTWEMGEMDRTGTKTQKKSARDSHHVEKTQSVDQQKSQLWRFE